MPAELLRGAEVSAAIGASIIEARERLIALGGRPPQLATFIVGDDPSSIAYRSSIARVFKRLGIAHAPRQLPGSAIEQDVIEAIEALNRDDEITGVLAFLPMPNGIPASAVFEHLSPLKDVDGISPMNAGRLHMGLPSLQPGTPRGGIELLRHYGIQLEGRNVTVIGRSNVVGRPLASLLLQRNATVTICHTKTSDLAAMTLNADIVCVAAGSPRLLREEMVKPGAVVIDFGVNALEDGSLVGDVDFDAVSRVAGAITPVPGGTGPVTSTVLARNIIAAGFAQLSGNLDDVILADSPPDRRY